MKSKGLQLPIPFDAIESGIAVVAKSDVFKYKKERELYYE